MWGKFGDVWEGLGGIWRRFWWEVGDIFSGMGEFSRDCGVTRGGTIGDGGILRVVLGALGVDSGGDFGGDSGI